MINKRIEWEDYKINAIKIVIKYASEQGVKLRRNDFSLVCGDEGKIYLTVIQDNNIRNNIINILIPFKGRWGKSLKREADGFLNYINARITADGINFSFAFHELERWGVQNTKTIETNEDKIKRIIRKASKILALSNSERNPFENEVIDASLKVQKLLAQYNLTLADVMGEHRPEEEMEQVIADVEKGKKWKYKLAEIVARNYACRCYFMGAEHIVFFGYEADILIARRIYVYLFKAGDRFANQYVKKYKNKKGLYNSYVNGFTGGVSKELEKQCTALALIIQPEVNDAFELYTADFKTINSAYQVSSSKAYREGFEEGRRALNGQYIEEFAHS